MTNTEIVSFLKQYMNDTNTSQNKLAGQISISPSHLSAVMTGDHAKVSKELWSTLRAFVSKYYRGAWTLVSTSTYETVHKVCQRAASNGKMMVVKGASGIGKSSACRQYKLQNRNVYYVECISSDSVVGFLRSICNEMGIRKEMSRGDMVREIAKKLVEAPQSLLIIDEAGQLKGKSKSIVALKDIYNLANCHAGIVLVGVDYLYSSLEDDARREKEGFPELLSRVAYAAKVGAAKPSESLAIIEANGLADLEEVCKKHIIRYANGDLRKLNDTVEQVIYEMKDVTLDLLQSTFIITK